MNFGIIEGTEYRNAPAVLVTPRGATQEAQAPMCDHSIPHTTEDTTEEYVLVPLRHSRHKGLFAKVDPCDAERILAFKWYPNFRGELIHARRAFRDGDRVVTVYLHTEVAGPAPEGMVTDHLNGDGLDNRRSNIRFATRQQNAWNQKSHDRPAMKGVYRSRSGNRWSASILVDRKRLYLGSFLSAEDAARAYDAAARRHFGEFAYLNFPEEGGVK